MAPKNSLRWVCVGGLVIGLLALAQVVGHSYATYHRGWSRNSLPVYLYLGHLGDYWRAGATTSARVWNTAAGRSMFSWSSSAPAASCSQNGRNDVYWSDRRCGQAWGNTQAVTRSWETSSGHAAETDVFFNNQIDWGLYSGRLRSPRNEFQRVALHEFGHVLGLDHPDDYGQSRVAVMNSRSSDIDRLQFDDLDGLRFLYGGSSGTPDLVVQSLRASDSTLTARQRFTLSARVRNSGSGTAASTTLRYWYWQASSSSWVVVGYDSVGSLRANGSSNESIALNAPSSTGSHWYTACVDSVSGERNTSNCSSEYLRVTVSAATVGRPDLVVSTLRASPSTLRPGQSFSLSATVRNTGTAESESTTLDYRYWQASSSTWTSVGSDVVGTLRAGSSGSEQIALTAPSSTGDHWYAACVSYANRESNRSNNCSSNLRVTVSGTTGGGSSCASHLGTLSSRTVIRNGAWTGQCQTVHYTTEYARYYSFTLSRTTTVTMDLASSTVDTWLALYTGSGMGSSRITSNNNSGSGSNARIVRSLAAGTYTIEATTYRVRVTGSFRLTVAARDCRLFDCLQVDKEGIVRDAGADADKAAAMPIKQP